MKKTKLLLMLAAMLFITGVNSVHAQDMITKTNGEDIIKVKVLEITQTEIKYKRFESQDGPTYTISKTDVLMIHYQDGTKDVFSNSTSTQAEPATNNTKTHMSKIEKMKQARYDEGFDDGVPLGKRKQANYNDYNATTINGLSMAEKGKLDAKNYYRGYHGAAAGTFLVTFFTSPVFGLIPALGCSSRPPLDSKLDYPDEKEMQDYDYRMAYRQEAWSVKKRKIWISYGIGAAISAAIIISAIAIASSSNSGN